MLHLMRRVKSSKGIEKAGNLIFAAFSYALYLIAFVVHLIVSPFLSEDFNIIRMYIKQ